MSFPIYRFTLSNTIEGDYIISEPGGWDDSQIKLERNEKYHSLVEFYDQPLTFYGSNGNKDGGLEYIRNIEATQGADADITIIIEVNFGSGYETLFEGLLDLSQIKEVDFYKADIPILRNGFWSKFINRESTSLNIRSVSGIDNFSTTVIDPITLNLPTQKLRKQSLFRSPTGGVSGSTEPGYEAFSVLLNTSNPYAPIVLDVPVLDEIRERYTYPVIGQNTIPFEIFEIKESGSYDINAQIWATRTGNTSILANPVVDCTLYYRLNDGSPVAFTQTNFGIIDISSRFTFSTTVDLKIGDFIYFYIEYTGASNITFYLLYNGQTVATGLLSDSYIELIGDTIYVDTDSEVMPLNDAAESILSRVVGQNSVLNSDLLSSGCASDYVVTKGLHLKTYTFDEKPFNTSWKDFWDGIDPIFCLGLGYEEVSPSVFNFRIEGREYFYDSSSDSVLLSNVNNIERSYLNERIYKKIDIGYQKWESENISGIDDPQTKHTYSTRFKKIGEDLEIYSKFIAASLAIESTRRESQNKSKDYRLDNDTFIINVDLNASPPVPYTDGNFSSVTGLLNPETRYNIGLSPKYNFYKWVKALAASFKPLNVGFWQFTASEGNADMVSNTTDPCSLVDGLGNIGESDDVSIADLDTFGVLHGLEVWEFEHPLDWETYKTIRENREKSIGVSQTSTGHESFFILSLEYQITKSKAKFKIVKA